MFEIGNSLREARVRQQLELGEVELATKIRGRYLRALEEESFDALPAQTYVKGFLRTYADYLGLDGQLYVDEFNSRFGGRRGAARAGRRATHLARGQAAPAARTSLDRVRAGGDRGARRLLHRRLEVRRQPQRDDPEPGDDHDHAGQEGAAAGDVDQARRDEAGLVPALRARAERELLDGGAQLVEASGKSRFTGTVEPGQSQRFVSRRLWVNFGNPGNLAVVYNGHLVRVSRPGSYLFTTHGFSRAA